MKKMLKYLWYKENLLIFIVLVFSCTAVKVYSSYFVSVQKVMAEAGPVVELIKTASLNSIALGETVTYRIKVQNSYEGPISNIVVKDVMPENTILVSPNPSFIKMLNGELQWNIDPIQQSAYREVEFTVRYVGTPIPGSPSNLTASDIYCCNATLNWVDNSNDEQVFIIERGKVWDQNDIDWNAYIVPADTTTFTDPDTNGNFPWNYRVYGAQYEILPDSPTNLVVEPPAYSYGTTITWKDNSSDEDGFILERSKNSDFSNSIKYLVDRDAVYFYVEHELQEDNDYFRISAIRLTKVTNKSNDVNIAPSERLIPPTDVAITAISANEVTVSWKNHNMESSNLYVVERSTSPDFTNSVFDQRNNYNTTSFTDRYLDSGKTYYYRVYAAYAADGSTHVNYSEPSSSSIATTPSGGNVVSPTNLQVTTVSSTEVSLVWSDNANNESSYSWNYCPTGDFTIYHQSNFQGCKFGGEKANITSSQIADLIPGQTYYFRVSAGKCIGYRCYSSDYTNIVRVDIPQSYFNPPSNLTATPVSRTEIRLEWTDNSTTEKNFFVDWAENIEFTKNVGFQQLARNTNNFLVTGLIPGRKYYFRVSTYDGITLTPESNVAEATTLN